LLGTTSVTIIPPPRKYQLVAALVTADEYAFNTQEKTTVIE